MQTVDEVGDLIETAVYGSELREPLKSLNLSAPHFIQSFACELKGLPPGKGVYGGSQGFDYGADSHGDTQGHRMPDSPEVPDYLWGAPRTRQDALKFVPGGDSIRLEDEPLIEMCGRELP